MVRETHATEWVERMTMHVAQLLPVRRAEIPAWILPALLVICMFAPYGVFSGGGGSLRPDHLIVPFTFAALGITGRLRFTSPLVLALFALIGITMVSTALQFELFLVDPMFALRNLDGLLRGPAILTIAASITPSEDQLRKLTKAFVGIAFVLMLFAIVDQTLDLENPVEDALIQLYGGPLTPFADTDFMYNHKILMWMAHRATAVFVTAPALSMVTVFLLVFASTSGTHASARQRQGIALCCLVAGMLSNSKTFAFGVAILVLILVVRNESGRCVTWLVLGAVALAAIGFFMWQQETPLAGLALGGPDTMTVLSGGRFVDGEQSVWAPVIQVFDESPWIGYGAGLRAGVKYSDSGWNSNLLYGGILGLTVVVVGIGAQAMQLFAVHERDGWVRAGLWVMALGVLFFAAGAVYLMPRVNDLYFTLVGVAIARANALRA